MTRAHISLHSFIRRILYETFYYKILSTDCDFLREKLYLYIKVVDTSVRMWLICLINNYKVVVNLNIDTNWLRSKNSHLKLFFRLTLNPWIICCVDHMSIILYLLPLCIQWYYWAQLKAVNVGVLVMKQSFNRIRLKKNIAIEVKFNSNLTLGFIT